MTKENRKFIFYILLMVLVTGLTIFFVLKNDPVGVFNAIGKCDIRWILLAILVVLAVYLIESLTLFILARLYNKKYYFHQGIVNNFIGVFFSDITPFNSGGQFVQAYTFSKQGVKVTNAASILYMQFIVYQIVLVLYSGLIIVFKYDAMSKVTQTIQIFNWNFNLSTLSFVGFGISALIILGLFFMAYSKWFLKFVTKYIIGFLSLIRIIKNKEETIISINDKLETFRDEMVRIIKNWKVLFLVSVLILIKLVLFNSIPYFIAHGMGLEFTSPNELKNFINTTSMTTLVATITQMVPLPGASGGAELVFNFMFGGSFFKNITQQDISALVLMWRGISFFFGLTIGAIVFVTYQRHINNKISLPNTDTSIDLSKIKEENNSSTIQFNDKIEDSKKED